MNKLSVFFQKAGSRLVAIVMCVSINAGEMKTFEKSHMYRRKLIH